MAAVRCVEDATSVTRSPRRRFTVAASLIVLAAVNTVLDPDQESEALQLAREIARGLESGTLEPTASAIEPLADTLR